MKKRRVKVDTYEIVTRAVEEGVRYGLNRAYKHTDDPSREQMEAAIYDAVTLALCEVIKF